MGEGPLSALEFFGPGDFEAVRRRRLQGGLSRDTEQGGYGDGTVSRRRGIDTGQGAEWKANHGGASQLGGVMVSSWDQRDAKISETAA